MQRPAAAKGAILRREGWRFYSPVSLHQGSRSDPIAGYRLQGELEQRLQRGAGSGETGCYVLDVRRGRAEFPKLKAIVAEMAAKWKPDPVLFEDAASGQSLIQGRRHD